MLREMSLRRLLYSAFVLMSLSCFRQDKGSSFVRSLSDTMDSVPTDPLSIESQLKRYIGQKDFLNIVNRPISFPTAQDGKPDDVNTPPSAGAREIQEADLFKVGRPGSKLLYLINPYRGLQVVDFSAGAESPKLLGRAPVSGNDVLEMYFDAKHMQIVVLERFWDMTGQVGPIGRLLTYSVKDAAHPSQVQSIDLPGDIADTRLVGEILYVATSQGNKQTSNAQGWISSYNLDKGGVTAVASYPLSLPVQQIQNLNIVETKTGDTFSYYAILTIAQNVFNWQTRRSTVEVVDISDSKGAINPILMVSTKGELKERSSTTIKDGTLLAVSNAWQDRPQGGRILNVAVESFKLPTSGSQYISSKEAEFRRLWFERELANRPADANLDDYAQTLQLNPEFGLKGIFVRGDDGHTSKIFPDQLSTVGDSTGLHASLQDVRFVNDSLYVFWVPANQVDPLDIFDISHPAEALPYLGRTLFEGWMERAIPFAYGGENYLLGLGWIITTTATSSSRDPQIMIFKMPKAGGSSKDVVTVAQKTLKGQDLYAYFNAQDKTISARIQDDGTGYLLFPASTQKGLSGGKLLSFNLNTAEGAQITEGGFLAADASWLRRVFENSEISKLHSLSDRSLSTFDLDLHSFGSSDQIFDAISILELARDIRAFTQVAVGANTFGVQIVDLNDKLGTSYKTQLRVTPSQFGDAELADIILKKDLNGHYLSHLQSASRLLVLTSRFESKTVKGQETSVQIFELHRIRWSEDPSLPLSAEVDSVQWEGEAPIFYPLDAARARISIYRPTSPQITELEPGRYAVISGMKIYSIQDEKTLTLTEAKNSLACLPADASDAEYIGNEKNLYFSYSLPYDADDVAYNDLQLIRREIAPVDSKSLIVDCSLARNIPGRPLAFDGERLITDDDRFIGFQEAGDSGGIMIGMQSAVQRLFAPAHDALGPLPGGRWPLTLRTLDSLSLQNKSALLNDLYGLDSLEGDVLGHGNKLFMVERSQAAKTTSLGRLGLNAAGQFERDSWLLAKAPQDLRILSVFDFDKTPHFLLQSGHLGSIVKTSGLQLETVTVRPVLALNSLGPRSDSFLLPESLTAAIDRIPFDVNTGYLSIAQGLWGLQQVVVEKD